MITQKQRFATETRLDRIGNFDSQNRAIRILLLPNFPGRAAPRGLLQQYRPRTVVSLPGVPCSTRRATLPNPPTTLLNRSTSSVPLCGLTQCRNDLRRPLALAVHLVHGLDLARRACGPRRRPSSWQHRWENPVTGTSQKLSRARAGGFGIASSSAGGVNGDGNILSVF